MEGPTFDAKLFVRKEGKVDRLLNNLNTAGVAQFKKRRYNTLTTACPQSLTKAEK
ncbi:MAG: hypothetical protein HW402_797 [Dehalococcoidales bacterium]|nr:hypothetical protein [Dehalococcoidales bacterium]